MVDKLLNNLGALSEYAMQPKLDQNKKMKSLLSILDTNGQKNHLKLRSL